MTGIILILFSFLQFYTIYLSKTPHHIFWLCNHVPLVMGLAILFRNNFVLIGEFSLDFIGMLTWDLDFIYFLLTNKSFTGNEAFFTFGNYLGITAILHFLTLPLALIAIILIGKVRKRAFIFSIFHFLIIIPILIYFGKDYNLNCLFKSCLEFIPTFRFYTVFLLLFYLFVFIIPITYLINRMLEKIKNKN
jgi:hypothetical protein